MYDSELYDRIKGRAVVDARGCWIWTGAKTDRGYGFMEYHGKQGGAHRFMYRAVHGPVPDCLYVCHVCDNPGCVNPGHLFAGTPKDNYEDSRSKGRNAHGDTQGSAKLAEIDVIAIRDSSEKAKVVAGKYGVHIDTVHHIRQRRSWKHLCFREIEAKDMRRG